MSVGAAAREGRRRTTEVAMTDCITRWAREFPDQLADLDAQVKFQRATLHKESGMSKGGRVLHKGLIPPRLMVMLQQEIDKDWLWNPELRNKFWRIFKVGCINLHSEMNR